MTSRGGSGKFESARRSLRETANRRTANRSFTTESRNAKRGPYTLAVVVRAIRQVHECGPRTAGHGHESTARSMVAGSVDLMFDNRKRIVESAATRTVSRRTAKHGDSTWYRNGISPRTERVAMLNGRCGDRRIPVRWIRSSSRETRQR